ncbi:YkgJ family cysteine cluster protein [uncultured Paludibaculum sp.]|uniref:YkgJ family cysteine cluster protein n=1 Tax=uncultured Paludibaculum sp. TaxID=1765020 RepID=UPI002AAAF23C|nr:YkgJ family cysteine cluster protein [uncultured Paludibaculum sp.]
MVTDLVQIRSLADAKESENTEFRRFLRHHHTPDQAFYDVAVQIEHQIDCQSCANCCRQTRVNLTDHEIARIAAYLHDSVETELHEYIEEDPSDHRRMLRQKDDACVFLDGNLCMIYDARPDACHNFPHVDAHGSTLGSRMSSVVRNAWICPILYNALEEHKHRTGWHLHHHESARGPEGLASS